MSSNSPLNTGSHQLDEQYLIMSSNSPLNTGSHQLDEQYLIMSSNSPLNTGSHQLDEQYLIMSSNSPLNTGKRMRGSKPPPRCKVLPFFEDVARRKVSTNIPQRRTPGFESSKVFWPAHRGTALLFLKVFEALLDCSFHRRSIKVTMNKEHWWNDANREGTEAFGEKPVSEPHSAITDFTQSGLGLKSS